jgi:hypothetical protein
VKLGRFAAVGVLALLAWTPPATAGMRPDGSFGTDGHALVASGLTEAAVNGTVFVPDVAGGGMLPRTSPSSRPTRSAASTRA